jgi:hypothetical protein
MCHIASDSILLSMCCYVFCSSGPCPPIRIGSGATTCLVALDTASPVGIGFAAATCLMASDITSRLRWVSTLSRVYGSGPCLQAREGPDAVTRPTVPNGREPQIYKERSNWPIYVARLVCF